MILWLNGTYGVGKSTIAQMVSERLKDGTKVVDPDSLWRTMLKNNPMMIFGDGAYPQNNNHLLSELSSIIQDNLSKSNDTLIIPMTISETKSYDKLIKTYQKKTLCHIVLYANENVLKERIISSEDRDITFSLNNISQNNVFLTALPNTTYIDTSYMTPEEITQNIIDIIKTQ